MPYKERSKYKVFMEISGKCTAHKLPNIISETEEILTDNSSNQANEFVIEEVPVEQKKVPEEEAPPPIENDFEIELKQNLNQKK